MFQVISTNIGGVTTICDFYFFNFLLFATIGHQNDYDNLKIYWLWITLKYIEKNPIFIQNLIFWLNFKIKSEIKRCSESFRWIKHISKWLQDNIFLDYHNHFGGQLWPKEENHKNCCHPFNIGWNGLKHLVYNLRTSINKKL